MGPWRSWKVDILFYNFPHKEGKSVGIIGRIRCRYFILLLQFSNIRKGRNEQDIERASIDCIILLSDQCSYRWNTKTKGFICPLSFLPDGIEHQNINDAHKVMFIDHLSILISSPQSSVVLLEFRTWATVQSSKQQQQQKTDNG